MTDAEIISEAIRLTGVERYRYLCSSANALPAPNSAADYLDYCRRVVAAGGHPGTVTAPASDPSGSQGTITVHYGGPAPSRPCCG